MVNITCFSFVWICHKIGLNIGSFICLSVLGLWMVRRRGKKLNWAKQTKQIVRNSPWFSPGCDWGRPPQTTPKPHQRDGHIWQRKRRQPKDIGLYHAEPNTSQQSGSEWFGADLTGTCHGICVEARQRVSLRKQALSVRFFASVPNQYICHWKLLLHEWKFPSTPPTPTVMSFRSFTSFEESTLEQYNQLHWGEQGKSAPQSARLELWYETEIICCLIVASKPFSTCKYLLEAGPLNNIRRRTHTWRQSKSSLLQAPKGKGKQFSVSSGETTLNKTQHQTKEQSEWFRLSRRIVWWTVQGTLNGKPHRTTNVGVWLSTGDGLARLNSYYRQYFLLNKEQIQFWLPNSEFPPRDWYLRSIFTKEQVWEVIQIWKQWRKRESFSWSKQNLGDTRARTCPVST